MTPLEFRDSVDNALRLAVPDIVSCVSEYKLCALACECDLLDFSVKNPLYC